MASVKFCALKINLPIGFTRKSGWNVLVGCNDEVPYLNKATSRIFKPLKISKFTCILSTCLPATCLSAVRPSCAKLGLQKFHTIKVMVVDVVPKTIYPLRHGYSFYPSFDSFPCSIFL